jgi:hypothetical protein
VSFNCYPNVIINIWLLLIAVLLLWFPRPLLRLGSAAITLPRRRGAKQERAPGDFSLKFLEEIVKPRNWVDFLRALAGGLAVMYICFDPGSDATKPTLQQILLIQTLILIVAVIIQTIRIDTRLTLVAPIFFVMGLSFSVIGWKAAIFCCITIWTLNLVLPTAAVFLFAFAGLEVCFGLLLGGKKPVVLMGAALAILPVIFSLVTKRRLVQLNKKSKVMRTSS